MTKCPIIIIPCLCLGKFNPQRRFGMMWYNVTPLEVFFLFWNFQNQSAAGNVIQLNKNRGLPLIRYVVLYLALILCVVIISHVV